MRRIREFVRVFQALIAARRVQDFLLGVTPNDCRPNRDLVSSLPVLQKRIDKLAQLDQANPHWDVEARKRLLQLAAVSIWMMERLDVRDEEKRAA